MDALSTNYLDAVFSGNRKYTETDNGDGTVSFTDSTTYTQTGSRFGASDINATNGAINSVIRTKTVIVPISGWSSSAPYTNTVTVSGITASDTPIISLNLSSNSTATTAKASQKAWAYITAITTGSNSITLYAHTKPTVALPIVIKGV